MQNQKYISKLFCTQKTDRQKKPGQKSLDTFDYVM